VLLPPIASSTVLLVRPAQATTTLTTAFKLDLRFRAAEVDGQPTGALRPRPSNPRLLIPVSGAPPPRHRAPATPDAEARSAHRADRHTRPRQDLESENAIT